jgi:hypothetical protein
MLLACDLHQTVLQPTEPVTLCESYGAILVTAGGQILLAAARTRRRTWQWEAPRRNPSAIRQLPDPGAN